MSRTKARVISSLRMRRCSQRRKMTNCTRTATSAVSQPMSAGQLELGKCIGIFSERYQEVRRLHGKERSEEHTSELQSHLNLVCRLLLEKKKQSGSEHEPSRRAKARHVSQSKHH